MNYCYPTCGGNTNNTGWFFIVLIVFIILFLFWGNGSGNNALSKFFTVETLGNKYIKLTPIASTSGTYSKLVETVASSSNARFVRFSLKGTGENLIITHDEPIE